MTLKRVWMPSPCYSSRGGSAVRLIVVHTAEGARTIESLGNFFANSANGVSSHTGADDQLGKVGEYVTRGNKAWTQGNANPVAVSLELCGFASWTTAMWKNDHHNMLRNCADWLAEEAKAFGVPLTALSPSQAQGSGRGTCQHIDLGSWGGGHVDCGSGFPLGYVLDMARGEVPAATPAPPDLGGEMIYLEFDEGGTASLTFANEEADGKHRVRVFCSRACDVEIDLASDKAEFGLGWEAGPQGLKIPAGVKKGAVRYIAGPPAQGAKIAFVVSESS
jgi:hypothetical protein